MTAKIYQRIVNKAVSEANAKTQRENINRVKNIFTKIEQKFYM